MINLRASTIMSQIMSFIGIHLVTTGWVIMRGGHDLLILWKIRRFLCTRCNGIIGDIDGDKEGWDMY